MNNQHDHERGTKKRSESPTGFEAMTSQRLGGSSIHWLFDKLRIGKIRIREAEFVKIHLQ